METSLLCPEPTPSHSHTESRFFSHTAQRSAEVSREEEHAWELSTINAFWPNDNKCGWHPGVLPNFQPFTKVNLWLKAVWEVLVEVPSCELQLKLKFFWVIEVNQNGFCIDRVSYLWFKCLIYHKMRCHCKMSHSHLKYITIKSKNVYF